MSDEFGAIDPDVLESVTRAVNDALAKWTNQPMMFNTSTVNSTMNLTPGGITWVDERKREPKATFLDGAIGIDDAGMFAPGEAPYGDSLIVPPGWRDFFKAASFGVLRPESIIGQITT